MAHINRKYSSNLPVVKFNGTIVPHKHSAFYTYNNAWYQLTIFWYSDKDALFNEQSSVYDNDGRLIGFSSLKSKDSIEGYSGGCAIVDAMRKTGYEDVPRIRTYECLSSVGYVLLPF